ncbi:MAG: ribonuclease 3 [Candidatus Hepatoplasma vulgare]|nr:MAG: ribonuclease 3 [Candidatus Hepatoplasma sp.]
MNKISDFLQKNNIKFKNLKIYEEAFSHMSYINEIKKPEKKSYERLEFLGDSILSQIVAIYVFNNFSDLDQGELTLLRSYVVKKEFLSKVGKEINLQDYINIGNGERNNIITDSVIEDVFESLIAAIYLDSGYEETYKFLNKNILVKIKNIDIDDLKDYKTKLQEFLQNESEKSIEYNIVSKKKLTSNNELEFFVEVSSNGIVFGRGKGKSKKEAAQNAAKDAYQKRVKK